MLRYSNVLEIEKATTMKRKTLLLMILLITILGAPVFGQMDMLPQIFRDLPPELQQGIPQNMSFQEYRQLNRNVDFFTMFMSLGIPGYGLFHVERPVLGWTVVGFRTIGYGLMGIALYRQWNDLADIYNLRSLDGTQSDRLKENVLLMAGGVIINGLGWAFDIIGAYHIAKQERDFVLYKYGLQETLTRPHGSVNPTISNEISQIEFIRRLVHQGELQTQRSLSELQDQLTTYRKHFPLGEYISEVIHYQGLVHEWMNKPEIAFLFYLEQIYGFNSRPYSTLSRQSAARLFQESRSKWADEWPALYELIYPSLSEPESFSREDGLKLLMEQLLKLSSPNFLIPAISIALQYAQMFPDSTLGSYGLWYGAKFFDNLNQNLTAIPVFAELASAYPRSSLTPPSLLRIAELLIEQKYFEEGERFYNFLATEYANTVEGQIANGRLSNLELGKID